MPGTRKVEIRKETRLFDDFFSNRAAIAQNGLDPGERPLWEDGKEQVDSPSSRSAPSALAR